MELAHRLESALALSVRIGRPVDHERVDHRPEDLERGVPAAQDRQIETRVEGHEGTALVPALSDTGYRLGDHVGMGAAARTRVLGGDAVDRGGPRGNLHPRIR